MGKRLRRRKGRRAQAAVPGVGWWGPDGLHVVGAGAAPTAEELEGLTRRYRERVRASPLWGALVERVGLERAERMLLEFRVETRGDERSERGGGDGGSGAEAGGGV